MTVINNDNVVVKNNLTPNTRKFQSYFGVNFAGKKGKIVQPLINSRHEQQGFRVRFPKIKIEIGEDGSGRQRTKIIGNFEFPFYENEIEKIRDEIIFPTRHPKRRTRTQLQMDVGAVKRLRKQGLQIKELAKKFDVSRQTIHQWLKRQKCKVKG